MLARQATDLVI